MLQYSIVCRNCAKGMTSVRLSVTLVYCDHAVQQKVEYARIGRCLGYLQAEADMDCSIR